MYEVFIREKKMFESNPLTTRARLRLLFADGRIRTCAGEAYLISKLSLELVEFNVQKMRKNAPPPLKIIFFLFAMWEELHMICMIRKHEKSKSFYVIHRYMAVYYLQGGHIYSLLIYISSFLLLIVGCGTSVVLENSPKIILN
jgi:hypothetical protein